MELGAFLVTAFVITRLVIRSNRAARLSEERARLLDLTHDAVIINDLEGQILYWNRGAEQLWGWSAEQALGRRVQELMLRNDLWLQKRRELLATAAWQSEVASTTRDGKHVEVAFRSALERDASGQPIAILVTANDITKRKRTDEALRASEERWRAVFEQNPIMYFMLDSAGTVLSVNPFGAEQLGYSVEELVGRPVLNVFLEADREAARRHIAGCLERPGEPMSWELRKIRKDGSMLWGRETARTMRTADGEVAVLVVCEDITAGKRAEDELRASEVRFRTLVDHASDAFFLFDEPGNILDVNRQACESVDYTREELIGKHVFDLDPDLDLERIRARLAAGETVITHEARHRRKDGTTFPIEVRLRVYVAEDGRLYGISLVQDITDRKKARAPPARGPGRAGARDARHDARRSDGVAGARAEPAACRDHEQRLRVPRRSCRSSVPTSKSCGRGCRTSSTTPSAHA